MLVLTRKAGENIHIGDQIIISVVRINGQRARLGITAPRNLVIRREELLLEDACRNVETDVAPSNARSSVIENV